MNRMRFLRDERGQTMTLFALLLPVLIALVGLAVDTGWFLYNKMKIQHASDLSALSAAQKLPEDTAAAHATAFDIFKANYGQVVAISNINFFNQNRGIKVHYETELPLLFLPIVGIDGVSVTGKAEAIVQFMDQPSEVIPIAIFHTVPLVYGQTTVIYGDNSTVGNFGLIDLSRGAITGDETINTALERWIAYGYTQSDGVLPKSGEKILTVTGKRIGPVDKGMDIRIAEGRTRVICPVADFSKAKASSMVPILGFALFDSVSSTIVGTGTNETVHIVGKFVQMIAPHAITAPNAGAYGIKSIMLVK